MEYSLSVAAVARSASSYFSTLIGLAPDSLTLSIAGGLLVLGEHHLKSYRD